MWIVRLRKCQASLKCCRLEGMLCGRAYFKPDRSCWIESEVVLFDMTIVTWNRPTAPTTIDPMRFRQVSAFQPPEIAAVLLHDRNTMVSQR